MPSGVLQNEPWFALRVPLSDDQRQRRRLGKVALHGEDRNSLLFSLPVRGWLGKERLSRLKSGHPKHFPEIPCILPADSLVDRESPVFMRV